MERDFKGVWIPKDIWLNKELSILEKCLITEIDSLDNSDKGCFASNKYLSEFIGVSEGRCANIISDLKKREFIVQCFFDGRNRGLRLHENVKPTFKRESRVHENVKAEFTESLEHTSRKREHSNTVNNTGINTQDNKEISKEILPSDLENEKLRLEIERLNQALEEKNKKDSTKGGAAKPKKVSWLDLKEMELPEFYNDEGFRETWQSWCDFKHSRKESVLTDKGLELWFKKLETLSSRDLSISIQIVNESIANNWQGIFELKNQKSYATSQSNSQKSATPYGAIGGVNSQGRGMFLIPLDDSAESSQSNDSIEVEGFYQSEL